MFSQHLSQRIKRRSPLPQFSFYMSLICSHLLPFLLLHTIWEALLTSVCLLPNYPSLKKHSNTNLLKGTPFLLKIVILSPRPIWIALKKKYQCPELTTNAIKSESLKEVGSEHQVSFSVGFCNLKDQTQCFTNSRQALHRYATHCPESVA